MILPIYQYEKNKKKTLCTNEVFKCSSCEKLIENTMLVFVDWVNPPNPNIYYAHLNCSKNVKENCLSPVAKLNQFFLVEFVLNLPVGCVPLILEIPSLSNSKLSSETLFSNALKNDGSRIIDKTKHSFKESLEGVKIGADVQGLLEEKDEPLNIVNGLTLLDDIKKSSVPLLEDKKKVVKVKDEFVICQNCGGSLNLKRLGGDVSLETECYECLEPVIFPWVKVQKGTSLRWELKPQYKKRMEERKC